MRINKKMIQEQQKRVLNIFGYQKIVIASRNGYYCIDTCTRDGLLDTYTTGLKQSEAYNMVSAMMDGIRMYKEEDKKC